MKFAFCMIVGKIDSIMLLSGGGDDLNESLCLNVSDGTGKETAHAKYEMFEIHLDDKRGSRVRLDCFQ